MEGQAVELSDAEAIIIPDYYPETSHTCFVTEDPPLAVGTGVMGGIAYITGCIPNESGIKINYFLYDLDGVIYPEAIR